MLYNWPDFCTGITWYRARAESRISMNKTSKGAEEDKWERSGGFQMVLVMCHRIREPVRLPRTGTSWFCLTALNAQLKDRIQD